MALRAFARIIARGIRRAIGGAAALVSIGSVAAWAEQEPRWVLEDRGEQNGMPVALFVDSTSPMGRPAFKVETAFSVSPLVAARTVMSGMLEPEEGSKSGDRKVLHRSDREAIVYSFVDLPLMFADRELALRVVYSDDAASGVHRVDWVDANDVLPKSDGRVVRLTGVRGYWMFQPDGQGGSVATYLSQTEVGGSIPDVIAHRLMKAQTLEAAERLHTRIRDRLRTHVLGGSAAVLPARESSGDTGSAAP